MYFLTFIPEKSKLSLSNACIFLDHDSIGSISSHISITFSSRLFCPFTNKILYFFPLRGLELNRNQLLEWYKYRACEIEALSSQVDHALQIVNLAQDRYVEVWNSRHKHLGSHAYSKHMGHWAVHIVWKCVYHPLFEKETGWLLLDPVSSPISYMVFPLYETVVAWLLLKQFQIHYIIKTQSLKFVSNWI